MDKADVKIDFSPRQGADRKISKAWIPFAQNLTQVLSCLEEDQMLILLAKQGNRFIQFSCHGARGMRAEVTSNHFLEKGDRLNRREMAWLCTHGWNTPTGTPKQATPDRDPDGSPNYYIDFPASAPASDIASVATEALIHGLAFPYPGALSYESFDAMGGVLEFRELGLKPTPRQKGSVMEQVLSVFRLVTKLDDLTPDDDGDISVRYGAALVCATQLDNRVRLFSVLLVEVEETPILLRKLNQINDGVHRIRVFWRDEVVYAVLDLPGDPFVPAHLVAAMNEFSEVADGLSIVLRAEFAGKAIIESADQITCLQ